MFEWFFCLPVSYKKWEWCLFPGMFPIKVVRVGEIYLFHQLHKKLPGEVSMNGNVHDWYHRNGWFRSIVSSHWFPYLDIQSMEKLHLHFFHAKKQPFRCLWIVSLPFWSLWIRSEHIGNHNWVSLFGSYIGRGYIHPITAEREFLLLLYVPIYLGEQMLLQFLLLPCCHRNLQPLFLFLYLFPLNNWRVIPSRGSYRWMDCLFVFAGYRYQVISLNKNHRECHSNCFEYVLNMHANRPMGADF